MGGQRSAGDFAKAARAASRGEIVTGSIFIGKLPVVGVIVIRPMTGGGGSGGDVGVQEANPAPMPTVPNRCTGPACSVNVIFTCAKPGLL